MLVPCRPGCRGNVFPLGRRRRARPVSAWVPVAMCSARGACGVLGPCRPGCPWHCVPLWAPAACSARVGLGARDNVFRPGHLRRCVPHWLVACPWPCVPRAPAGVPVACRSARPCNVFSSRTCGRPSRVCGGPSRARHLPGRCGALVVLLRPFGAGWLASLCGRGLRVCRTLSPHSSGDRATASGAVCVGSNPTGGAFSNKTSERPDFGEPS
jgi:hypothetical protein